MQYSGSAIRIAIKLSSIIGFFLAGCVSGPVTTQIDTKKNPVVNMPSQFQSPLQALDYFSKSPDAKYLKDRQVLQIKNRAIKTLINNQAAIATELATTGKLRLRAGYSYEFDLESFCVNAGVERPVRGDGLFLGDIQGDAKSWLPTILKNYKSKGISQSEAQILIWSLLSKTRFDQLSSKNQESLLLIFPDAGVRFGNSILENQGKEFLLSQIPSELLSAKEQFDRYQEILQDTQLKFSEIEQVLSPRSSRNEALDVGWLKHQDGYYIHLQADGYQQVHVSIYAPQGISVNIFFDPTKHVALPGQGQRLALSTNVIDRYNNKVNQFIKDTARISAAEADFISEHPVDAWKIYQAGQKAIHTTWNNLNSSYNYEDDNTDAFRHFVWSGLVAHEIGAENAKAYLDAHEDFPENKPESQSMDLYNNGKGIEYCRQYHGTNYENDLIREGLERVRDHKLRWIK